MFLPGFRPTARQMNTIINAQDLWLDPNPTFNCTTTAYVNFPSASVQFTKLLPANLSDVRIYLFASAFLDLTPPVNHTLAVNIASTDYDITYHRFNVAQRHFAWSRSRRLPGLGQQTYTVQVRAKNDTAARTVTYTGVSAGSGAGLSMVVEELLL